MKKIKISRLILIIFVLIVAFMSTTTVSAKVPLKVPYKNTWLFTVGISKYEKLPFLKYPEQDVKYLESKLGKFIFSKSVSLLNEEATSANILNLLDKDFKKDITKDDLLVIFFASRSYTEEKGGKKSAYLLTYGSKNKRDTKNSISLGMLKSSLNGLAAKHILLILDTTISSSFIGNKHDEPFFKDLNRFKSKVGKRVVKVLTAGRHFEPMDPYGNRSLFVKILANAFNGDSDKNSDGLITGNELSSYVRSLVSYESNNKQLPEFASLDGSGELVFKAKNKNTLLNKVKYEVLYVPGGEFMLGSPGVLGKRSEKPAHSVYLNPFYIGKYEVTNAQYKIFVDDTFHKIPDNWDNSDYSNPSFPVVGVSHADSSDFCRWLGKRLPTEAEWEKAARGSEWQKYPWGGDDVNEDKIVRANTLETDGKLKPVGSYPAGKSPYGAFDMAGNVWEWVDDWYGASYYKVSAKLNPKGPNYPDTKDAKVLRGGSWASSAFNARSSYRNSLNKHFTYKDIGFRCAD